MFEKYKPSSLPGERTASSSHTSRNSSTMINFFGYSVNSHSVNQAFLKWADNLAAAAPPDSKLSEVGVKTLVASIKNVANGLQQLPLLSDPATASTAILNPSNILDLLTVDVKTIGSDLMTVYQVFSNLVDVVKRESGLEAIRLLGTAYLVLTGQQSDKDLNERFGRLLGEYCHKYVSFDSSAQAEDGSSTLLSEAKKSPDFTYTSVFLNS